MTNGWTSLPGNARNGQSGFVSYSRHPDGYEYALVITHDWHHVVWQRDYTTQGASWTSFDVSGTVIGISEVSDSHNGTSIGVDADGHIHVSGNTHDSVIRGIRSVFPHDITSWEEEPRIEKRARIVTNLAENGVVFHNLDGWSALDGRFTLDRTTSSYGWGSTHGNDTSTAVARLTRTANSPDAWLGIGQTRSITGNGWPVTPGQKYNTSLSFSATMGSPANVTHQMWLVFRTGETELSRVASTSWEASTVTLWYRCAVEEAVAPVGANNMIVEWGTRRVSGNSVPNDTVQIDGLMLYEGDKLGDIVYNDGSYNNGLNDTGWNWNGTPYASTSTGSIRSDGYAGVEAITYNRFTSFKDGTLVLSGAQPQYPHDPVGRGWSLWKLPPGETEWQPLVNDDGMLLMNKRSEQGQGVAFAVLKQGNPIHDDVIPDRAYSYHIYVDQYDTIHSFGWFRMRSTLDSWGHGLYIRSHDKGVTWEDVTGSPVTMPLYGPDAVQLQTHPMVFVNGEKVQASTGSSIAIDGNGHPHITYREGGLDPNLRRYLYWDGSAWQLENLSEKYAFIASPSVNYIRGDIWFFGARNLNSSGLAIWGANHTQDTGLIIRAGNVGIGTPDGVYQFESGADYEGAHPWSGGLDERGNTIYRACIPHNEQPRIFQFGGGVRRNITP